jgi:hypothetical protein
MDSSSLTTDLSVGMLTPAPAVRPADGNSFNRDSQDNARRSHPQPQKETSKDSVKADGKNAEEIGRDEQEPGGNPAHELDQLA